MDYDNILELVKIRRSIRKLKADPIPDEYIDKIIELARWSPSGANSQPWEFIVIKKQELKDKIIELINENNTVAHKVEHVREPELRFKWSAPGFVRAPVFIILCGDTRTKDAYPLYTVQERGSSHFTSNLANCFLYMNLAATSLGLGAQWVSAIAFPYVQLLTKELLKVPRELEFYDMMALGYPDMEPGPRIMRDKQEMVHYDCYDQSRFRTDKEVRDFIASLRR
jgi:nitroreductase